jgi:hypothetical protein
MDRHSLIILPIIPIITIVAFIRHPAISDRFTGGASGLRLSLGIIGYSSLVSFDFILD